MTSDHHPSGHRFPALLAFACACLVAALVTGCGAGGGPAGTTSAITVSSTSAPSSATTESLSAPTTEDTPATFDADTWRTQAEYYAGAVNGWAMSNDYRTHEPTAAELADLPDGVWHVDIVEADADGITVDFTTIYFDDEAVRMAPDAEKQNVDVYVGNESPETVTLALIQPDVPVLLQYPDEDQPNAYNLTATDYAGLLRKRHSTAGPGGDLGYYIWIWESKVGQIVELHYP
ncbi:MAG: hypothetical protein ACYC5Q_07755 [Thermoleophilia bacterium]